MREGKNGIKNVEANMNEQRFQARERYRVCPWVRFWERGVDTQLMYFIPRWMLGWLIPAGLFGTFPHGGYLRSVLLSAVALISWARGSPTSARTKDCPT